MLSPIVPSPLCSTSMVKASTARRLRTGWRNGATTDAPPRCSSSAVTTASPPPFATRPASSLPSAPPPGPTSLSGSCCWSRSTGPSPFCPAIPIIAPDVDFALRQDYALPMSAPERSSDSFRPLAAVLFMGVGLALVLTPVPLSAQSALDALRQRDQELEAIRAEQKKASEIQTKLKEEIDAIGEDRRKLNQALIDGAARLRDTEDRIA